MKRMKDNRKKNKRQREKCGNWSRVAKPDEFRTVGIGYASCLIPVNSPKTKARKSLWSFGEKALNGTTKKRDASCDGI